MNVLRSREERALPSQASHPAHRLVRLLEMACLIAEEPGKWTRLRLAEHFRVSERMVDHDLRLLRLAGYVLRRRDRAYYFHQQTEQTN